MISVAHNLKHQNYVFAYLVALRSANSKVRLSAKVRAELDAVFLATMGTKKHRDFVYAYHRAWLLHNTTATFGKTCASVQVLARLIARRNLARGRADAGCSRPRPPSQVARHPFHWHGTGPESNQGPLAIACRP